MVDELPPAAAATTWPTRSPPPLTAGRGGADVDGVRRGAAPRSTACPTACSSSASADGVRWYDDSKATTPHATLAAVRGFDSVVLIAGGRNKGLDLTTSLADAGGRSGPSSPSARPPPRSSTPWPDACPVERADSMDEAVAAADAPGPPRRRRAAVARVRLLRLVLAPTASGATTSPASSASISTEEAAQP